MARQRPPGDQSRSRSRVPDVFAVELLACRGAEALTLGDAEGLEDAGLEDCAGALRWVGAER